MNESLCSDSRVIQKQSSEAVTSQARVCLQGENGQVRQAESSSTP